MAPPPNSGDANNMNDDPLGGIDPMKWLESLAARQGANPDELTTSADIDVPVLPEDTVVDEPGYTPGYESSKPKPAAATPAPEPEPAPQPVESTPAPAMSADDMMNIDPMKWLESLAARQGANPDELTTSADIAVPELPADTVVDEPGYTPGYESSKPKPAATQTVVEPEPAPQPIESTPAPAMSGGDDMMNIDPMKWLESLAARQGANPDELTTEANIDIPVPENAVIDEPGYIDYDPFGGSGKPAEPVQPAQPAAVQPTPELEPVASAPLEDPLGGLDPLTWLESLASEQSPELADLLGDLPFSDTAADVSVSTEVPAMADEFGGMTPEEAAAFLGVDNADNIQTETDPMKWLESLSTPSADTEFLGDLAMAQTGPLPNFEQRQQPIAESAFGDTPDQDFLETGGMSNDINEVQAWLEAQATNLEKTRQELESTEFFDPDAPAEPASELPDWLKDVGHAPPTASTSPAITESIGLPPEPSELPDWLRSPAEQPLDDLQADLLNAIRGTGPLTPPAEQPPVPQIPKLTSQELQALTQPSSPDEVDEWAEALDQEYERKVAGDESVPDWYLEAITRAETEHPPMAVTTRPEVEVAPAAPAASGDDGLPDWLTSSVSAEEQAALPADIPDWLRDMSVAEPAPAAQAPAPQTTDDWLKDVGEAAAELPDWLVESAPQPAQPAPEPAPAPQPVQRPPEPAPAQPLRPAPQPSPAFAAQASPEHQGRLQQARQLASSNLSGSLEHYQALIDASQLLEETRGDLRQLTQQHPKEPRLRRLLGDTYMRLGDLQAALDTYRSALDQL